MDKRRLYFLLNCLALVLSLSIVFFSTHIRLGEAGLGCQPWPDCYPQISFADGVKGLTIPDTEFKLFRSFHRSIASLLGINILAIVAVALWLRKNGSIALPVSMLMVVIFLSVLGVATPSRAIPIVTAGNILGGIALCGLIWAHMVQIRARRLNRAKFLSYIFFALLVQIISGAWASANYTAAACPKLLSCSTTSELIASIPGSFNPARTLELDDKDLLLPDTSLSIIQYSHRILAIAWLILVIHMFRKLRHTHPELVKTMLSVVFLSLAEFSLGIINVLSNMPLWTNTLHNLLAAGLLFGVINLAFKIKTD